MAVQAPRPRMPSLNALRAFESAARLGHFGRAADELGVTPSAVAQQVRQLEDWLGCPLFHRFAHGVSLTDEARQALPRLAEGFDRLAEAVQQLRVSHDQKELSICALPSIAQFWLSPRLPRLRKAFPKLQVSLSAEEQPPNFRRDLYDLGLFYVLRPNEDSIAIPLVDDALLPVCSPQLVGDDPSHFSLDDLRKQPLLHDAVWRSDWMRWLRFVGVHGIDPLRGPAFSLYSLAVEAAIAGDGVLMGRRRLVEKLLASGTLIAPFQIEMPLNDRLTILLPKGKPTHRLQSEVVEWLRGDCAESETSMAQRQLQPAPSKKGKGVARRPLSR
jgi:LysR family transcriptional regulator, glycine cleavage system transcriptional activator